MAHDAELALRKGWLEQATEGLLAVVSTAHPVLLVGAAIFAWLTQPLLRFADPAECYGCGVAIALALLNVRLATAWRPDGFGLILGTSGVVASFVLTASVMDEAYEASRLNDRRCVWIEHHMLLNDTKRQDLPSIYEAMGCRPRTLTKLHV